MKCIIVEDDLMARKLLEQMVKQTPNLDLLETFSSSIECFNFLSENTVDLIFADIEMPFMTGFEMLSNLNHQPLTIFITKYKDFAVSAFDYNTIDFLVKPVKYERFIKAVLKAEEIHKTGNKKKLYENSKNLLHSIKYASHIQEIIIYKNKGFCDDSVSSFVFLKPKDIVSGDFYWSLEKKEHLYFAVVDCTGHGVPAALISMIATIFMNEINETDILLTPAEILDKLRIKILNAFSQKGGDVISEDGMDISLVCINKETKKVKWAGANNPLWVIKAIETTGKKTEYKMLEIKADKQPIGHYVNPKPFTNHILQLQEGDTLFLFSDGYADQFGEITGKKFMSKRLKELIISIQKEPMITQKEILEREFINWKGSLEQVDDVCIIGIRI